MSDKKIHFIDCGANKGQSIRWAMMKYGKRIERIDSFEPQRENFEVLEEEYSENENICLHEVAVWNKNEIRKFYPQIWGARTGSSLIEGKYSTNPEISINMTCIDLVEWIEENKIPDTHTILKLDIEGAEYDLLPYLMNSSVPEIVDEWFIEFHGENKTPNFDSTVEREFKSKFPNWVDWNSEEIRDEMKGL